MEEHERLELREELIKEFSEAWELNDKAHRVNHFDKVAEAAIIINERLDLGFQTRLIMIVSYLHDLFAWDREVHHQRSHDWMLTEGKSNDLINRYVYPFELDMVAKACLEHRASFKGEFSNLFSDLMNSADRQVPTKVEDLLSRARDFYKDRNPGASEREVNEAANFHIKEKYGREGYARYPDMYLEVFGEELEGIYKEIDNL